MLALAVILFAVALALAGVGVARIGDSAPEFIRHALLAFLVLTALTLLS